MGFFDFFRSKKDDKREACDASSTAGSGAVIGSSDSENDALDASPEGSSADASTGGDGGGGAGGDGGS